MLESEPTQGLWTKWSSWVSQLGPGLSIKVRNWEAGVLGTLSYNPCIGPQTGGGPIASQDLEAAARGPMASFGWNWPLAAPPGPGTARNQNLSTVGSS